MVCDAVQEGAGEALGPILPILRYGNLDEVINRANATAFGLGGSVWTSNYDRGVEVDARLHTGTVWINSAPDLTPFEAFAGHKQSGIGTEHGDEGLLEFTAPQTIFVPKKDQAA